MGERRRRSKRGTRSALGEGGFFHVTGTTTITDIDFATDKAGRWACVKFTGILTLTHNASTLILPNGGSNITTAAGDRATFVSEGSDVVICTSYQSADGTALQASSSGAGSGDFVGPGSSVGGDFVMFVGGTGKLGGDTGLSPSTDGTFAGNSDSLIPTQKAVKTYVDANAGGSAIGLQYPFLAGRLYSSPWNNDNNVALAANVMWLTPFVVEDVNDGVTFTTASIYVSTASAAGKHARLMIFADDGSTPGDPSGGTLIKDMGTVLVDSLGVISPTAFSVALSAGRYWLAMGSDGNPNIRGTGAAGQINSYMHGFLATTGNFPVSGYKATWTYGAAPSTCPNVTTTLNGNVLPLLYLNF
jgi:hypothetical protein